MRSTSSYTVHVIYHLDPRNGIRAVQFFRARPMLVGRQLRANTIFEITEDQLEAHRSEIEPMIRDRIIEIRSPDGTPFSYTAWDPGLKALLVPEPAVPAPASPPAAPKDPAAEDPKNIEEPALDLLEETEEPAPMDDGHLPSFLISDDADISSKAAEAPKKGRRRKSDRQ